MSRWVTAQVCEYCWLLIAPDKPEPFRIRDFAREETPCCKCGEPCRSGIYIRHEVTDEPL